MISLLKTLPLPNPTRIADIGSGSGCLGITAALELPRAIVYLYDVDPETLKLARQNARDHSVRVHVAQQDLLSNCTEQFDVLLANLPYVPVKYPVNKAAAFEPKLALFAGHDGLDLYRTFWQQVAALATKPSYVLTESLSPQHPRVSSLAQESGYVCTATENLVQLFKYES